MLFYLNSLLEYNQNIEILDIKNIIIKENLNKNISENLFKENNEEFAQVCERLNISDTTAS
jgi:hypothetical protein